MSSADAHSYYAMLHRSISSRAADRPEWRASRAIQRVVSVRRADWVAIARCLSSVPRHLQDECYIAPDFPDWRFPVATTHNGRAPVMPTAIAGTADLSS